MQKQMRADREKRAAILQSEGAKQSAILSAEGDKQAAVLRATGEAEAAVVRAEADAKAQAARARGEAEAITTVFRAIHEGNPDQELLAYRYLQALPQIAQGDANKLWIVPSEIGRALDGIGNFFGSRGDGARTDRAKGDGARPSADAATGDRPAAIGIQAVPDLPDSPAAPDVPAAGLPAVGLPASEFPASLTPPESAVNGAVPEQGRSR
jgi:hypothetical protein